MTLRIHVPLGVCRAAVGLVLGFGLTGCGAAGPSLSSPSPVLQARAAVRAADDGDADAIHPLVALLDSADAGTRLYSIQALERLTGETYGYVYYRPEAERTLAVERWRDAVRTGAVRLRSAARPAASATGRDGSTEDRSP